MLKRVIKNRAQSVVNAILSHDMFYRCLRAATRALPAAKIRDSERFPRLLRAYEKIFSLSRHIVNKKTSAQREHIALQYLIPAVNMLFDKNYVNYAQFLLLVLEEYFLSKKTEKEFEHVLTLFSQHAIAAGLRFRAKFPLPETATEDGLTAGFVGHFVAISGYEVVMRLGESMAAFHPRMYAMRVFDSRHGPSTHDSFKRSGIDLIVSKQHCYDVFALRNLLIQYPVDVAIWPMPPFHMFFFFSFGLAPKQVWLSQYLRPNLAFAHLDDVMTLGGAGTITRKIFNDREWKIVPQIAEIHGITDVSKRKKRKIMFTPARLEKLKQPEFLRCVSTILKRDLSTYFLWTGYYFDEEVVEFFRKQGLGHRNSYVPWLNSDSLRDEIKHSDVILACFPLSLGTVENIAAHYGVPIISMFDEEKNLYWRDIYWEAMNGNEELRKICLDNDGNSKILIARTPEEYASAALKVLNDSRLAQTYADVYKKANQYTYLANPNDVGGILKDFIHNLYDQQDMKENEVV